MSNGIDIPYSVSQSNSGGGFWNNVNTGLSNALGLWLQVEQVKAAKNAAGVDRLDYNAVVEVPVNAAVSVDENKVTAQQQVASKNPNITIFGTPVNKNLLIFSGVVLGLAVFVKKVL